MLAVGLCANVQSPVAFVVVVPALANVSTGNGSASMVSVRPPLLFPVSFPDSVTAPPNFTLAVFGAIVMFRDSGFCA